MVRSIAFCTQSVALPSPHRDCRMGCMCPVIALGWAALAFIGYRLFKAVANVVYPYKIAAPIDLKKAAGGEWAVVTGSTDGIGLAYAKELARKGFNILLVSRTQSKLDAVKKEIEEEFNVESKTLAYDFTNPAVADYENQLVAELNKINIGILVNNVGLSYEYPEVLHKIEGGLQRVADITVINTVPPTVLSAAVLPKMVERRSGVIVNIASSAAANPMSMWAVYSATKKYQQERHDPNYLPDAGCHEDVEGVEDELLHPVTRPVCQGSRPLDRKRRGNHRLLLAPNPGRDQQHPPAASYQPLPDEDEHRHPRQGPQEEGTSGR
ncbi:hypothetical protein L596_017986 [Steinernema carpocapsae]|uniref:Uncharacterized protein n=1 Tax=Steinernema carpocapsae TaxID=34508 RepID=A0A4U5N399_STECR|nr:hypothetical protein L596_017986 [Steinernema carpocapsae]